MRIGTQHVKLWITKCLHDLVELPSPLLIGPLGKPLPPRPLQPLRWHVISVDELQEIHDHIATGPSVQGKAGAVLVPNVDMRKRVENGSPNVS